MESFFIYLLKSAGIILLFGVCYQFFLKGDTFFKVNRWYLLLGILAAIIVPLISVTKIELVDPSPINFKMTARNLTTHTAVDHNYWGITLALIYGIGVLVVSIKLIMQLFSLRKLISKGKYIKIDRICKVETTEDISPFSFFNYIVYNPEKYTSTELNAILNHEKIHVTQKHSIDIVLAHLFLAFQWCNPFLWWYKNLIQQNLEFITDRETTASGIHKKEYQYLLLKTNSKLNGFAFTNPFFNSLIKKRIIMLNKKESHQRNLIKYIAILPMLIGFVMLFNVKAIAQIKEKPVEFKDVKNPFDKIGLENPLYIVNGIEVAKDEIPFKDEIETINVYKDETAVKKYGDKGKNGVVEIALKKSINFNVGSNLKKNYFFENYLTEERKGKEPLYIIDNKESTQQEAKQLSQDKIESINILKGRTAIKKYGAKARKGVVEIVTKK